MTYIDDRNYPQLEEEEDPWEALHRAIYRRARNDLLYGGRWAADAERFFCEKGIDPVAVRAAWAGRRRGGRRGK